MTKIINKSTEETTEGNKKVSQEVSRESTSWTEALPSFTAIGGILIAAIAAWVSIETYLATSKKDTETISLESKKPFFDKQMKFYVYALETISKIAIADKPIEADVQHFEQIYWGHLGAVEDSYVDLAIVSFRNRLMHHASQQCLKSASLLFAHCVKKSWEATWGVTLGAPPEFPCEEQSFQYTDQCN
jgi:hypothetical protein